MYTKIVAALVLGLGSISCVCAQEIYQPKRNSEGRVDFEGVWSTAWVTPLERSSETRALVIEAEQAQTLVESMFRLYESRDPLGALESLDFRQPLSVRGQLRSSLIVDPEDGRLPYTAAALQSRSSPPPAGFDGPEQRPPSERCLGNVNATAPFMTLPAGNIKQIIQTTNYLVIVSETYTRLRIIPLGDDVAGVADQGRGRWDGDAIVVETRGLSPTDRIRATPFANFAISPKTVITERFERISADEILYSYSVSDPDIYSRTWKAEMAFARSPKRLYEWGCQEANYSLANMLRGARVAEARAAAGSKRDSDR